MMTLTKSLVLVLLQIVHFSKSQLIPTLPSVQLGAPPLSVNGSIDLSPTVLNLLPALDILIPTLPPIDLMPLIPLPLNQTKFTCLSPFGIYPDPDDCHTYFVCVLNIYIRKKCILGKYFKPDDLIYCQEYDPLDPPLACSPCHRFTTPQTCSTSLQSQCSFCVGQNFTGKYRCDTADNLARNGCSVTKIYSKSGVNGPSNNLQPVGSSNQSNPVAILLPGDRKNVTISFRLQHHPLDLYLLMDISGSMSPHKASVVTLSSRLETALKNFTKDFTLGFGAFSDKVDAYTFKNILPLTNDTTNFSSIVSSTGILFGGDYPEDGGTGIFESIKCNDALKWRQLTRKIILLVTDAPFQIGGFGPLRGSPFNETCLLAPDGTYLGKDTLDYPLTSSIAKVMAETQTTVIFGVANQYAYPFYVDVSKELQPSRVGNLSSDSSNLIDLLETEYRRIASRIEISRQNDSTTGEIEVKFYSSCDKGSNSTRETSACDGIPLDYEKEVKFTVEIGLIECPKDKKDWNQVLIINTGGLSYKFKVPIELVCDK